jgi:hypothetical protein
VRVEEAAVTLRHRACSDAIERRDERLVLLSMSSMQLDQH